MKCLLATAAAATAVALSLTQPAASQDLADTQKQDVSRVRIKDKDYGYFFDSSRWPKERDGKAIIFVCWEKPARATYPQEVAWIRSAILESWEKHSRIDFRGWQDCTVNNQGIRIVVLDLGPRVKAFGNNLDGLAGGMELNFTFTKWGQSCQQPENTRELCIRSIAVHEFGHALGFAHEQDRADTPGECAKKKGTGTEGADLVLLTPYDPKSVMNYCNSTYNNDGKLSPLDIASVQSKYGVPEK